MALIQVSEYIGHPHMAFYVLSLLSVSIYHYQSYMASICSLADLVLQILHVFHVQDADGSFADGRILHVGEERLSEMVFLRMAYKGQGLDKNHH